MNLALYYASTTAFLVVPPLLVFAKWRGGRLPWWAIVLLLTVCEWLFFIGRVYYYFEHLCEPFDGEWTSLSPELEQRLARCIGDGGAKVFAVLLGWGVGLGYCAPIFASYAIATKIRRRRQA